MKKHLGWLIVALGGALVLAETFSDAPWQAGVMLGLVAAACGLGLVMEDLPAEED